MKREKELAKNTIIISFGQLLPKLTTLVTLPILTTYLTQAEYGTYDLINTLVSLIIPIIVLKLDMGVFRFLIECRDDYDQRVDVISTTYIFISGTATLSTLVMFFLLQGIDPFTKLLICIYFILDIIYITTQQMVRGLSRNVAYAASSILYAVFNMCFIVLLVRLKNDGLNGLLLSMIIGAAVATLFLLAASGVWKDVHLVFSRSLLKKMLSYSWPLIPNSLSSWVMNLSDRIIVTAILGIEVNAIYAVANKIPNLLAIVQSSFSAAWQENASLTVNSKDTGAYYSAMFDALFRILVGATSLLLGITPLLFAVLINDDYEAAYYQMPWLFAAMFFSTLASFLGGIYAAHKRTKSVGVTTSLAAICNFVVNFALIRYIGLYAASFSTFISYFLLVMFRIFDIRKFQKMSYDFLLIFGCGAILVVMSVLSHINTLFYNGINFIVGVVLAVVMNRKLLKSIINKFLLRFKAS